jgi:hypothetical protein
MNLGYPYTVIRPAFVLLAALVVLPAVFSQCLAQDPSLSSAGSPYAPLEVTKRGQDPTVPLSVSQRHELLGEFKGLVHMGLRKASYEQWEGKDMADCDKPQHAEDRWSYRCEIITGQGNGYYYFFPNESRQTSTLQELDIRVHSADEGLLDDFRRPVQDLFGRASFVAKPTVRSKPTGLIRHWNTGEDVAELFIDHAVRPEGSVRFVWMRSPLAAGAHARLPDSPTQP